MAVNLWFIFVVTFFSAAIIPGPSTLLGLNHGILYGKLPATATALGVVLAGLILVPASLAGVSAALAVGGLAFKILKTAGALYLIYVGIQTWRSTTALNHNLEKKNRLENRPLTKLFSKGFLVGISNLKAIIFFTAFLPQFIDTERALLPQYAVILLTNAGIIFISVMLYSLTGAAISRLLKQPKVYRYIYRVSGALFICFGTGIIIAG